MSKLGEKLKVGCLVGCRQCPGGGMGEQDPRGALSGWRLSVAALVVFLVPLILALLGSVVAGSSQTARLLGAICGLTVGVAAAILTARLIRPAGKEAT